MSIKLWTSLRDRKQFLIARYLTSSLIVTIDQHWGSGKFHKWYYSKNRERGRTQWDSRGSNKEVGREQFTLSRLKFQTLPKLIAAFLSLCMQTSNTIANFTEFFKFPLLLLFQNVFRYCLQDDHTPFPLTIVQ